MSALNRFLGGSPLAVAIRLTILSFIVGLAMVWLDLRPRDVFAWFADGLHALWQMGAESLEYLALGAAVVVPVFLLVRLLNWRGGERR